MALRKNIYFLRLYITAKRHTVVVRILEYNSYIWKPQNWVIQNLNLKEAFILLHSFK